LQQNPQDPHSLPGAGWLRDAPVSEPVSDMAALYESLMDDQHCRHSHAPASGGPARRISAACG